MLAVRRFCSTVLKMAHVILAAFLCFAFSGPLTAQVQGVPSMQFQGVPASGIGGAVSGFSSARPGAASSSSLLGCCASFFFPSSFSPLVPYPSATSPQEHKRHHHMQTIGADAVYVPYAVGYADDSQDAAAGDQDADSGSAASDGVSPGDDRPAGKAKSGSREAVVEGATGSPDSDSDPAQQETGEAGSRETGADANNTSNEPPEPVQIQPVTVLIFKDGHRAQIVNYAIVGDSLFQFSGGRTLKFALADLDLPATQKANDALGVEFKLPPQDSGSKRAN